MLPVKKNAIPALTRMGIAAPLLPVSVSPLTVLPFLTRNGSRFPATVYPSSQIVPEAALCEQGSPPPDRGPTETFPFPPDPSRTG